MALGIGTNLAGVIAFSVTQRTLEVGVRRALGASRRAVLGMVLSQAVKLVGIGLALGIAGALASGRAIQTLLFDVHATDAVTYVGVSAAFLVLALLACLVPARRAASVDPMIALWNN